MVWCVVVAFVPFRFVLFCFVLFFHGHGFAYVTRLIGSPFDGPAVQGAETDMSRVAELCKMSDKGYAASMVVTNHNKKVCLCFAFTWFCVCL